MRYGMVTRRQVVRILAEHGWAPDSPTVAGADGWVNGTSFDDEVGVRAWYSLESVLAWLGY